MDTGSSMGLATRICFGLWAITVQTLFAAENTTPAMPTRSSAPPSIGVRQGGGCLPGIPVKPGSKLPSDLSGSLPVADYLDGLFDCANLLSPEAERVRKSRSEWLEADARQYGEILARGKFSWLVIPAQTQYFGFDRTERMLVSAEIGDAFVASGEAPSTFLVARSLGEIRRRYEPNAGSRLAMRLNVTRMLEIYLGHDGQRRMTLTLQLKNCSPNAGCTLVKQHDWRNLAFSDEHPPFVVIREMRDALVHEMLGGKAVAQQAPSAPKAATLDFSGLGAAPITAEASAVSAVIAALVPGEAGLGRDRLEVLALRDALNARPSAANRVRAAYAAYRLNHRPYALKLIEGMNNSAAVTLRELLNGNLPEAVAALKRVDMVDLAFILGLSVQDLKIDYERPDEFDSSPGRRLFGPQTADWAAVTLRRAADRDTWARSDGAVPKLLLDRVVPIAGQDLKSVVKGLQIMGRQGIADDPLAIPALRHLQQAQSKLAPGDCCSTARAKAVWPIYWLAESIIEANMLRSVSYELTTQGEPKAAKDLLDQYEPYFSGQPDFEVQRYQTLMALAKRVPDEVAARLQDQAEAAELLASYWAQGQSDAAVSSSLRRSDTFAQRVAYSKDFPGRPVWLRSLISPTDSSTGCSALDYSTTDVLPVLACLATLSPAEAAIRRAEVDGRFHGNSRTRAYLKQYLPAPASDPAADLRAAIRQDADFWDNYRELAILMMRSDADYVGAQKVYLSYPEFKRTQHPDPVELSNQAYEAGSELYWRGQFELARPLYAIAAELGTGSHASMTSEIRLLLLDGNYESAAEGSLERALRYPNPYAYRDYLSLMFVLGHGSDAQAGFQQIANSFDNAPAWLSELVGQRMQSMTSAQFRKWILSDEIRDAHYRGRRYAPIYALWWMTTDRKPPLDFAQTMALIEKNAERVVESDGIGFTRPIPEDPRSLRIVRPSTFSGRKSPRMAPDSNAPSEYILLADALVSHYAGDYEAAVQKFVTFAYRYPIEQDETSVALSYFALAAAKTGDKVGLESWMEKLPDADLNYDVWLSRAYFSAVRHQNDAAIKALIRAVNVRPHTDSRPIVSEYQYLEACETVFRETHDRRAEAMILDWAKRFQKVHPMYSWAYAVEAQYSKKPGDVNRALAMTLYLDPMSPRIAKLDPAKIAAARTWIRANNPFQKAVMPKPTPSSVTQVFAPAP